MGGGEVFSSDLKRDPIVSASGSDEYAPCRCFRICAEQWHCVFVSTATPGLVR